MRSRDPSAARRRWSPAAPPGSARPRPRGCCWPAPRCTCSAAIPGERATRSGGWESACPAPRAGSTRRCATSPSWPMSGGSLRASWHAAGAWTSSSTTPASSLHRGSTTADGIELTFATNVLGPFLLTSLLLPALAATATPRGDHRLLGRHVHGSPAGRRSRAPPRALRRISRLRPHQADRGDPQPALGGASRLGRHPLPLDAPRLGRDAGAPPIAAAIRAADAPRAALAARREPTRSSGSPRRPSRAPAAARSGTTGCAAS